MNKERRKVLAKLGEEFAVARGKLLDIAEQLESIKDEEQEAFDNMPESLQQGERGQASEGAIERMDEIIDKIKELDELDFDAIEE